MNSMGSRLALSDLSHTDLNGRHSSEALLAAEDLHLSYQTASGSLHVLRGVSLEVRPGEAVGLVGESGSGKSTFARAALGLLSTHSVTIDSGRLTVAGEDVGHWSEEEWGRLRGNPVAIVFQDPLSYLNPVLRLGFQISEALRRHDPKASTRARIDELLQLVQLPPSASHSYPHELSGGMRQRGLLAMALACRPRLLIADEPTTALDVTTQAEILRLLRDLQKRLDMALLLITHDLGVVSSVCDRVYVMYAGEIMETGPTRSVFDHSAHPYTKGLIESARMLRAPNGRFATVPGDVPSPAESVPGCPFGPRCKHAFERCVQSPPAFAVSAGQSARCWLLEADIKADSK
jgi:oligopeptide/dipeptide ABC transporter ATP-binding protein